MIKRNNSLRKHNNPKVSTHSRASKCVKQLLRGLKGKRDEIIIAYGDLNVSQ